MMETFDWTAEGKRRKKQVVVPPWPTAKIQFIDDHGPTFTVCWVDRNLS